MEVAMSIWGTLGEVAVGTAAGGAILGPGGAIIGGAAGLGGGDLGQGARDVGGWLVNTLSDADCLVCKSNPIWWETVAAVAAARAAGIINTPDDCAVYAQKGTEITDIVSSGQVPSSQSDAFGKCACKQVFGATGQVAGDAEKTASQQAALSANVAVHYLTSGGGAVSCVSRWADHLDIFAVSHGEGARTAAWQPGFTAWHGWWRVGDLRVRPGSRVSGVVRGPDKLDIFAVGVDGGVYTAAWEPGFTAWHGWWRIGQLQVAPKTPVSVTSRSRDKLDIFTTGLDGRIYTAAWQPGDTAWRGWWVISD